MYENIDEVRKMLLEAMDLKDESKEIIPMEIHMTGQYEDLIFIKENPETLEEVTKIFSNINKISNNLSRNDKWKTGICKMLNNQGYNYGLNIVDSECYHVTSATITSLYMYYKFEDPLVHSEEAILFSIQYMLLPYCNKEIKLYLQLMNKLKFRFF